jgi:hypothetical protein
VTRRRLTAAAAVAVVLAGLLVGALLRPRSPTAGTPAGSKDPSGPIVLVGTGGLSWSDVSARTTPALWSLLRDGATAALTVRSVHANTCPVDGWLTLSAGEQAGDKPAPGEGSGEGAKPPCRALPDALANARVPRWDDYLEAAAASSFDARLGLLGDQVAGHGGCIQAVGPGAALGAARANGTVDRYQPFDESTLAAALASCPATLVDVGAVRDPADVSPADAVRHTTSRAQQVAAVDARVAAVLKAAPRGADVVLASLADAGVTERLRLVAAAGPRFGPGTLRSSSTRQSGLVQLADLTPTVLEHLGIPRPSSLGGTPLELASSGAGSERSAGGRLRTLLDDDQASHEVHSLVEPFFYGWVLVQLAVYLVVVLLWRRGWGTVPRGGSGAVRQHAQLAGFTGAVGTVVATLPVSTFLANVLPWWRFSVPLLSMVASVGLFAAAISAVALLGPWRRSLFGPLVVVCVVTMAVLGADVMTGSRLQLSSLLGLQPVVGGRFYGMGNVTFAVFATAALMLCIAVGDHFVRASRPRAAAAAVAAIGAIAVIVDASPSWGSDLGGPPALLPGVFLLILTILSIRLTWRRWLAIGAGIVGFLVVLSLLDWLRPAESRSHLGRFVQTALDGGAQDIIARKLDQNVALLFVNRLSLLIPVGLVLMVYTVARPASRAARPLRRSFERIPLLRPGLIAVLLMWIIGFVLNDSGAGIPAAGAILALPLVLVIALRTPESETPQESSSTTRAARRAR